MKITKYGHCCLFLEIDGKNILTDPGGFSVLPESLPHVDIVLITHEHGDHLHVDSLKNVLKQNPDALVVTNTSVGKILDEEKISYKIIDDGKSEEIAGVLIEGHGTEHAEIFQEMGAVDNTGYFLNDTFFYPGDAFTDPSKKINILAVPVAAPWLAIKEVIRYVQKVQPEKCIPVHDAVLSDVGRASHFGWMAKTMPDGTQFHPLDTGDTVEL